MLCMNVVFCFIPPDATSILQEVHEEVQRLEQIEMEKTRQAQIEEEENRRILPKPRQVCS